MHHKIQGKKKFQKPKITIKKLSVHLYCRLDDLQEINTFDQNNGRCLAANLWPY